jgi:hypothetical protein
MGRDGWYEVAQDSGYISEPDDDEDFEQPACDMCGRPGVSFTAVGHEFLCDDCAAARPRNYACDICDGQITSCPHGRSDFDPVGEREETMPKHTAGPWLEDHHPSHEDGHRFYILDADGTSILEGNLVCESEEENYANAALLAAAPALAERVRALEAALRTIATFGQVCSEYDTCTHRACAASYSAWTTATEALAAGPPTRPHVRPLGSARGRTMFDVQRQDLYVCGRGGHTHGVETHGPDGSRYWIDEEQVIEAEYYAVLGPRFLKTPARPRKGGK